MKTLAIANQKGGVGKTTITVHLAHLAQEMGLRVLIVDIDPAANTSGCFTKSGGAHLVGSDLFAAVAGDKRPENAGGVGLIRADHALHDAEALPLDVLHNPAKTLNALAADYDLCLIDTPPTLGRRLMAALVAADFVVSPLLLDKFSLDGLEELTKTIRAVLQPGMNPGLKSLGLLPNRVKSSSKEQMAALGDLTQYMGGDMLPHLLHDRVAIPDSLAVGRPVWKAIKGESHKRAAQEMRAACEYILNKVMK